MDADLRTWLLAQPRLRVADVMRRARIGWSEAARALEELEAVDLSGGPRRTVFSVAGRLITRKAAQQISRQIAERHPGTAAKCAGGAREDGGDSGPSRLALGTALA